MTSFDWIADLLAIPAQHWRDQAACAGSYTHAFFPDVGEGRRHSYRQALKFCAECDVTDECYRYAVEHDITDGVWGGKRPAQRR